MFRLCLSVSLPSNPRYCRRHRTKKKEETVHTAIRREGKATPVPVQAARQCMRAGACAQVCSLQDSTRQQIGRWSLPFAFWGIGKASFLIVRYFCYFFNSSNFFNLL